MTGPDAYLEFLRARDGTADLARQILPGREARHVGRHVAAVCSRRAIDAVTFARNLERARPEPGLDDRMLWLLATAKANCAERFAVGFADLYGKLETDDAVLVHVTLQEIYHTRLLGDVVALFGLRFRPQPPARHVRAFIRFLLALPEGWRLPLTGAAEMTGCVLFRALRDRGIALCADEPAVSSRVRELYDEILADEIGHVGHIAARLGPTGRRITRVLFRALGARLATSMPELQRLFGRRDLAALFAQPFDLPAMVDAMAGQAYACAPI